MTKTLLRCAIPAMVLALAACQKEPSAAQIASSSVMADDAAAEASAYDAAPAPPTDAATYLAQAEAGNAFEIAASRAVIKTTKSPEIGNFARMMISAHEDSAEKIRKAAMAAQITPPAPDLPSDLQGKLDAIKNAQGEEADKLYLASQRELHQAALALHKAYAAKGDTDQLKVVAGNIVPVVRDHITMLDKMASG